VDGIHEPIVSKKLFDQVQMVLDAKKKKHHVTHSRINPSFPLKGFLLCPECQRPLTASVCKGRSERYAYYHCISPCKGRYRLEEAETSFLSFLKGISLDKPVLELLNVIIKEQLKKQLIDSKLGPKHYEKVKLITDKLIKIQDLFIDGLMDKTEYAQAKKRYQDILDELELLERNQNKQKEIFETYKNGLSKLQNFDKQYINSDIHNKRLLTGLIFPNKFGFQNKKVQTADINPLLLKISSVNKGFQSKKKRDKPSFEDLSRLVNSKDLFSKQMMEFLRDI
jgi:site-specific DNA recombinase